MEEKLSFFLSFQFTCVPMSWFPLKLWKLLPFIRNDLLKGSMNSCPSFWNLLWKYVCWGAMYLLMKCGYFITSYLVGVHLCSFQMKHKIDPESDHAVFGRCKSTGSGSMFRAALSVAVFGCDDPGIDVRLHRVQYSLPAHPPVSDRRLKKYPCLDTAREESIHSASVSGHNYLIHREDSIQTASLSWHSYLIKREDSIQSPSLSRHEYVIYRRYSIQTTSLSGHNFLIHRKNTIQSGSLTDTKASCVGFPVWTRPSNSQREDYFLIGQLLLPNPQSVLNFDIQQKLPPISINFEVLSRSVLLQKKKFSKHKFGHSNTEGQHQIYQVKHSHFKDSLNLAKIAKLYSSVSNQLCNFTHHWTFTMAEQCFLNRVLKSVCLPLNLFSVYLCLCLFCVTWDLGVCNDTIHPGLRALINDVVNHTLINSPSNQPHW